MHSEASAGITALPAHTAPLVSAKRASPTQRPASARSVSRTPAAARTPDALRPVLPFPRGRYRPHRQGATGVPAAASAWEGPATERSDRRAAIPAQQAAKGLRPLAPDAATPPQPPRTTNPEPTNQAKRAAKGICPLAPDAATPKPRLLASRRPPCSFYAC